MVAWLFLLLGGACEAAFAILLKRSNGFTVTAPAILSALCAIASIVCLSVALRTMTVATAYAVWTGLGVAGTVVIARITLGESLSWIQGTGIAFVLVGLIILRAA
jgi:quaternary ammonium compound-resistance protein SugE